MKFYQHNHSDEFAFAADDPKVRLYDVLLAETDPDLVHLEMDIYWAYAGQFRFSKRPDGTPAPFDPLDYVLAHPHRYPLFHVKDGVSDPANEFGYRMTDVGDGDIDYQRFISTVTHLRGRRLAHHWQTEHDNPHGLLLLRPPLQRVPALPAGEVLTGHGEPPLDRQAGPGFHRVRPTGDRNGARSAASARRGCRRRSG